jgi:hypothetical protein
MLIKVLIPDFDKSPLRSLAAIACASIVMSLLLGLAEKIGQRKRDFDTLGVQDGILMGLAQAMSLIPGVSRSGSTMTAGLFMGLERATAARFSFLLGIPCDYLSGFSGIKGCCSRGSGGCWNNFPHRGGNFSGGIFLPIDRVVIELPEDSEYLGIHLVSLIVWSGNFECDLCRTAAKHLANINSSFFSRDATGESICGDCLFLERG